MNKEKRKPHLSASQISMFLRCGRQWYYRYVEKDTSPPSGALHTGKATHKAVEEDLRHKMETGELLPWEAIRDIARDTVNAGWEKEGAVLSDEEILLGEKHARGQAVDRAVDFATAHHEVLAPKIDPVFLEREFRLEMQGYPYDLMGFIDIQEEDRIRDTKTKSSTPSQESADASLQLSMYSFAAKVVDGKRPNYISLDALVNQKRGIKVVELETRREDSDDQVLMRQVAYVMDMIESEKHPPADPDSWMCTPKWCGYYAQCPFGQPRRVQVSVGAV